MNKTLESMQAKQESFDSSSESIFAKLPEEDQQKLAIQIVAYLMNPLSTESRYKRLAQKFSEMQTSIIQVVEHRVRLQHQVQLNELKEEHFAAICLLYEKVKERDATINELGKRIKELDTRYLMKVAEMEEARVYNEKLKGEVERMRREQKQRVRGNNERSQVDYERDEIGLIQHEIISLKQVMKTFISSQTHQPQQSSQPHPIPSHSPSQPQTHSTNHRTHLQQQLKTLKSQLSMRLQMLQQSDEISQKYESTQQQLIHGLMEELMRVKKQNLSVNLSHNRYGVRSYEQVESESQLIQQEYERSQNSLNDLLEVELVDMKQRMEKAQDQKNRYQQAFGKLEKRVAQLQAQLNLLNQQLSQTSQKLTSTTQQNSSLVKQLQSLQLSSEQSIKTLKLLYETKLRELELLKLNQAQRHNSQLDVAAKKMQWLEQQLIRVNRQLTSVVNQNAQLSSSTQVDNQKMEQIVETNRSLQNEKVLLKTLNKKLNKELIEAQTKATKLNDQCIEMKSKIQQLESKLQDSQQIISSLKLELEIKHQKISEITVNIKEKELMIQTLTLKIAENEIQISQIKDQLQNVIKQNQLKYQQQALKEISNKKSTEKLENQLIERQQKLKQRQEQITTLQQDLNNKIQTTEQKNYELAQKQQFLKNKQKQNEDKYSDLQKLRLIAEKRTFQNEETEIRLNKLQHQLKEKQGKLQMREREILDKEGQLERLRTEVKNQIFYKQKSPNDQLSTPPSPIEIPMSSPPISPSPFRLESSQPMIPINEDSVKIKLQFIDVENPSNLIQNLPSIPINLNQQMISQTCHQLADKWMSSEQQKWKSIHTEIDSIYKMLLQSQL